MTRIILLLLIWLFISVMDAGAEQTLSAAEQKNIWLQTLGDFEYPPSAELRKDNVKDKYLEYNFSTLLTPKTKFLGYIAPNFRRIEIYFTSVSKDPRNAASITFHKNIAF